MGKTRERAAGAAYLVTSFVRLGEAVGSVSAREIDTCKPASSSRKTRSTQITPEPMSAFGHLRKRLRNDLPCRRVRLCDDRRGQRS